MRISCMCPIHNVPFENDGCSQCLYCPKCGTLAETINIWYVDKQGKDVVVRLMEMKGTPSADPPPVAISPAEENVSQIIKTAAEKAAQMETEKCRSCNVYWGIFFTYTLLTFVLVCSVTLLSVLLWHNNKMAREVPVPALNK